MPLSHLRRITYTPQQRPRRRRSGTVRRYGWRLLRILIGMGITGAALCFLAAAAVFAWYARDLPDPSNLTRRTAAASTKIYDRTGQTLLYEIATEQKRTPVKLSELPEHVKHATIVAEDRDFYAHQGFDLTGIVRAALVDILKRSRSQGGSTITQQLIKNSIVGNEKSYSRKIKELILAYRIEQRFSKDEILEMYFNTIPYGGTAYGIEAAAQLYFKKSAQGLTIAEASVLAAMAKAPSYFSPYGNHRDELIARQHYIIDAMLNLGYLEEDNAKTAKTEELTFIPLREGILAPHFVFYLKELLAERYGEREVETGGLKIISTLDLYKQRIAEEEVAAGATRNEQRYGANNAALVALDPKTGQILAMVGSRDYFAADFGNVNVTTRPRQPGSSFKPIVYAAGFTRGFTPETLLYDVVTTFKTGGPDYTPHNYDGKEHGLVTVRQALAGSLNIPAVKMLYLAGVDRVLDLADRLGYTTLQDRSRFGLALVLGGGEIKLLEHAAAFQSFAREGLYNPPVGVLRIEDARGRVLEEFREQPLNVLSSNVARQVTSILSDNAARTFVFGATSPLILGDRPVAAKTGTTNDWRDGWTLGYTPSLVAGVWVGNNDNAPMARGADGVLVAAPIWNHFMSRVLGDTPHETFRPPDSTTADKPVLRGEVPNAEVVVIDRASGKRATELTPPAYREERRYGARHSILHYLSPTDPTGPAPENPALDPNYNSWEAAVARWATTNNLAAEAAPPEFDDVHTQENRPIISVTSPRDNETIRSITMPVIVSASAPRGLKGIRLALDGSLVIDSPVTEEIPVPLSNLSTGFHTLRVQAYDDVENTALIEVLFNYLP